MEFKLWSDLNVEAKNSLKPDLGLQSWDELAPNDKEKIWNHLETHFFNVRLEYDYEGYNREFANGNKMYHPFFEPNIEDKQNCIIYSIVNMHNMYKVKAYTKNFIKERTGFNACLDFYKIFLNEAGDVVFELLSLYCQSLIKEINKRFYRFKDTKESDEDFKKDRSEWKKQQFHIFSDDINEVFSDFGLNVHLTLNGFIPKQDAKIVEMVFEPVLKSLADDKWKDVNKLLTDAFFEYGKNTPNGYSTCVTHTVSSIQAFLQIIVLGKIGTGDISKLIVQGQKEKLIPDDMFTKEVFKPIESILMRERQETGDAHPKKEYASERNAKMVLNLAMIFMQHCLTV